MVDIIFTITVRGSTIALVSQGFVNCCTTVWEIAVQDLQQVNNIKSLKVIGNGAIQQTTYHFLLVVSSNDTILRHFWYITVV